MSGLKRGEVTLAPNFAGSLSILFANAQGLKEMT